MSERHYIERTGLERYANTDPSLRFNGIERRHDARWCDEFIECLKKSDYEAAELIRSRSVQSEECLASAHDSCFYLWCRCPHHSQVQFELEHPQLKSLSEITSEQREMEDAA